MTNDGRVFFTTEDALVHGDTNEALDVYEYVDGRPQLITPGTGETRKPGGFFGSIENSPGLDRSQRRRHRRLLLDLRHAWSAKTTTGSSSSIYDARAGGGFPAPAPPPPCDAADECHGAGSSPPAPLDRRQPELDSARRQRSADDQSEAPYEAPQRHHKRKQPGAVSAPEAASARSPWRRPQWRARDDADAPLASDRARRCVAAASALPLLAGPRRPTRRSPPTPPCPSTTQAGGHPDLEVQFTVSNRFVQHSQSACDCEDAKDATVHLPAGFIGNPHATPQCTIAEFSADTCPIDSQVGIVNVLDERRRAFPSTPLSTTCSPARRRRPARLQDLSLRHPPVHGAERPHRQRLRPRRDGHLDLSTAPSRCRPSRRILWGVPADPSHDPLRLNAEPGRPETTPSYLGYALRRKRSPQHRSIPTRSSNRATPTSQASLRFPPTAR